MSSYWDETDDGGRQYLKETRKYDILGRLTERMEYFGPNETRHYYSDDFGGNIVMPVSGMAKQREAYIYDKDGRTLQTTTWARENDWYMNGFIASSPVDDNNLSLINQVRYRDKVTGNDYYDVVGRLARHEYQQYAHQESETSYGPSKFIHTFDYTYAARDSYLEILVEGVSNLDSFKPASTRSTYDLWGNRTEVTNYSQLKGDKNRIRTFAYDGEGHIIARKNGTFDLNNYYQVDDKNARSRYYYSGGNYLGELEDDGGINFRDRMTGFVGNPNGAGSYTVQQGDTLRLIAGKVYGNENLWYVIADANAFQSDDDLRAGAVISLPEVTVNSNDAGTFKPYNPMEQIGSTTPNLPYVPPPSDPACSKTVQIIVLVVMVVITVYTAGTATSAAMKAGYGFWATAASVGATTFSMNVMSQAANNATGLQQGGVDWNSAARAGITSGVMAGVSAPTQAEQAQQLDQLEKARIAAVAAGNTAEAQQLTSQINQLKGAMALMSVGNAAASYTMNYGLGKAMGDDVSFSLRDMVSNMATSGVLSAMGSGNALQGDYIRGEETFTWSAALSAALTATAKTAMDYVAHEVFGKKGKFNSDMAFYNNFGNELGNAWIRHDKWQEKYNDMDEVSRRIYDAQREIGESHQYALNSVNDPVLRRLYTPFRMSDYGDSPAGEWFSESTYMPVANETAEVMPDSPLLQEYFAAMEAYGLSADDILSTARNPFAKNIVDESAPFPVNPDDASAQESWEYFRISYELDTREALARPLHQLGEYGIYANVFAHAVPGFRRGGPGIAKDAIQEGYGLVASFLAYRGQGESRKIVSDLAIEFYNDHIPQEYKYSKDAGFDLATSLYRYSVSELLAVKEARANLVQDISLSQLSDAQRAYAARYAMALNELYMVQNEWNVYTRDVAALSEMTFALYKDQAARNQNWPLLGPASGHMADVVNGVADSREIAFEMLPKTFNTISDIRTSTALLRNTLYEVQSHWDWHVNNAVQGVEVYYQQSQ